MTLCPLFTRNASPPSILIRFQFCFVCLKELVHVHRAASRISEILIRYQLALIKDDLLCHLHSCFTRHQFLAHPSGL